MSLNCYNYFVKSAIRSIVFSFISLSVVSSLVTSANFGTTPAKTLFLVALGLGFIDYFSRPLLKVMSLPAKGPFYLVFVVLINVVSLFTIDKFLGGFSIVEGTLQSFKIVYFVVNSYTLSVFWGYVLTAALYSLILVFFNWLSSGKK